MTLVASALVFGLATPIAGLLGGLIASVATVWLTYLVWFGWEQFFADKPARDTAGPEAGHGVRERPHLALTRQQQMR